MEKAGLRSPPGRMDRISSGLTGGLIEYFTPLPLHVLLDASSSFVDTSIENHRTSTATGYIFAGCLSRKDGEIVPDLAALHFDAISGDLTTNSMSSLVSIAKRIDPKMKGLRTEMVFADSPIPSRARITFTRPEDVFGLLESSIKETRGIDRSSPYVSACVAGFFLAYLHPFNDANGRWSRVLVSAGFGGESSSFDAALCAFFLYVSKKKITRYVWPNSMRNGLLSYIDMAVDFKKRMCDSGRDVFNSVERLRSIFIEIVPDEKVRKTIEKKFFSHGRIDLNDFKGIYRFYAEQVICRACVDVPIFSGDGFMTSVHAWEELMAHSHRHLEKI